MSLESVLLFHLSDCVHYKRNGKRPFVMSQKAQQELHYGGSPNLNSFLVFVSFLSIWGTNHLLSVNAFCEKGLKKAALVGFSPIFQVNQLHKAACHEKKNKA